MAIRNASSFERLYLSSATPLAGCLDIGPDACLYEVPPKYRKEEAEDLEEFLGTSIYDMQCLALRR